MNKTPPMFKQAEIDLCITAMLAHFGPNAFNIDSGELVEFRNEWFKDDSRLWDYLTNSIVHGQLRLQGAHPVSINALEDRYNEIKRVHR